MEKEYTFFPKTNKNKKKLLNKFDPSINFYERNDFIKNIKEAKIKKLESERFKELLKECTFEPCKNNKKKLIKNPIEISNRLYYNNSNRKISNTNITNRSLTKRINNKKEDKKKAEEDLLGSNKIFHRPKLKTNNLQKFSLKKRKKVFLIIKEKIA